MCDAGAMRRGQCIDDLNRILKRMVERQRACRKTQGERLAFEILHDQKIDAVLTPDIVERADMRVIERRNRARLALEPLARLGIARHVRRQDLDRDGAIQARVAGFVDLAHAARAKGGLNLVGAKTCSSGEAHGTSLLRGRRASGAFLEVGDYSRERVAPERPTWIGGKRRVYWKKSGESRTLRPRARLRPGTTTRGPAKAGNYDDPAEAGHYSP